MRTKLALFLPAAALIGGAALAFAPQASDGKPAFKLGVVNLRTCFNKSDRMKDALAELDRRADKCKKELQDLEKKVLDLRDKKGAAERGSNLYWEKSVQLRQTEAEFEILKDMGQKRLRDYMDDATLEIYNEIRKIVDKIAQDQKFDLVLRVEAPLLNEQDPESVSQRIYSRVVLYQSESADITAPVVQNLNEEWQKQKGKEKK